MNPHAGKARLKPEMTKMMREVRESLAAEAFAIDAARAAMMAAVKSGYAACVLGPKGLLNLKETAGAAALLQWLQAEGFAFRWEQRQGVEAKPGAEAAFDLVVSW